MADMKLNPHDKSLAVDVLEEALKRAKASPPIEEHRVAVERYKRELEKLLKKLNPKGWY